MTSELIIPDSLQPQELKAIYEISRVILQTADTTSALQQIIHLTRPVFIFDNAVLYQLRDDDTLEPTYARAVGRGRSAEADAAWGEMIAIEVIRKARTVLRREEVTGKFVDRMRERMRLRYFLGVPLRLGGRLIGALIFIRFGGPPFVPEQIQLAEFIVDHVAQLLERQQLVGRIASLEAEKRLAHLQENFVATISHDLRSPLGFIKGYATTLLREDTNWDDKTRREFLMIIDEEADRLSELIDNLLDSSRLQTGTLQMDFQRVRLDSLLQEVVQRMLVRDQDLRIELDLTSPSEIVWADPTRLVQVLDNLVDNAARYAPGSTIKLSLVWQSDKAHLMISDDGPGIPEEHLEDIFNRFYRLPEHIQKVSGSGLGLFICRQIIEAHDGEIHAESVLGEGTTFHIYIPKEQSRGKETVAFQEVPT